MRKHFLQCRIMHIEGHFDQALGRAPSPATMHSRGVLARRPLPARGEQADTAAVDMQSGPLRRLQRSIAHRRTKAALDAPDC